MARTVAGAYTHTHGNLINKKETSMNYALLKIYLTDQLII